MQSFLSEACILMDQLPFCDSCYNQNALRQLQKEIRESTAPKQCSVHLENVLPLVQHVNFCMDNYDHLISNNWIFGYALFFCACSECTNNKQAF